MNRPSPESAAVLHIPLDDADVYLCDLRVWCAPAPIALSPEEDRRAGRLVFARHRHAFELAHQFLRHVLGQALSADPAHLAFTYSPLGKPALAHPAALHFNLSHSAHHAAVAISHRYAVGVDIEELHPVPDAHALAQQHFSLGEQSELRSAAEGTARDRRFLQGWTRKEACLKAIGSGLSLPASAVDAGLAPLPRQLGVRWQERDYSLALCSLDTAQDLIGALATVRTASAS